MANSFFVTRNCAVRVPFLPMRSFTIGEIVSLSSRYYRPLLWTGLLDVEQPEPPVQVGNAFSKQDSLDLVASGVPSMVMHQNRAPNNNTEDATYIYWPTTETATTQNFNVSTWTGGKRWAFIWVNRRNYSEGGVVPWNPKSNILPSPQIFIDGLQVRANFTTRVKADAATRAQIRHILGFTPAEVQADWIIAGGSVGDFVAEEDFRADPGAYATTNFIDPRGGVTYRVMIDKVFLPTPTLATDPNPHLVEGILIDWEPQDSRTSPQVLTTIQALAADCHAKGKKIMWYGNPLTAVLQNLYNGMDATTCAGVLDVCDFVEVKLWSKAIEGSIAASYAAQLSKLGTIAADEWAKIVIGFELGGVTTPGTTLTDAQWVRAKVSEAGSTHPDKVIFWRNYAQQGGSETLLVNKKISMICFGTETH